MRIWVDADSCPVRVREIIAKASSREFIDVYFVANRPVPVPPGTTVHSVIVPAVEGKADSFIVENVHQDDLVVTRDIPLASELVALGITVLNDRGTEYSQENVRERLSIRNVMQLMREQGLTHDRLRSFGKKEVHLFSNAFDRILRKHSKK